MLRYAIPVCLLLLVGCGDSRTAPGSRAGRAIDADADALLRKMSTHLAAQSDLRFVADVVADSVAPDGAKLQQNRRVIAELHRPDRLHARSTGENWDREYCYDGRNTLIYDRLAKTYSVVSMPGTIDAMLDTMAEKYAMSVPTTDLLVSDPYASLTESARTGRVVGASPIGDTPCTHLAFTQEYVDWQIWIQDGPNPLPKKLVVTYKSQPAQPQFSATFAEWASGPIAAEAFALRPPADAHKVEMATVVTK